jgi:DNA repair/transcription protein MET18/MMS19
MKKDFIAPYISLADGEKDPRNLLVAFAIARVILIEFDPTDHIEVRPLEPSNSVSNAQ